MVTVDYDGVSTKLMIILMIVLGIWVVKSDLRRFVFPMDNAA